MLAKLSFQAPEINPFQNPHFSTFSFSPPSPSQISPENPRNPLEKHPYHKIHAQQEIFHREINLERKKAIFVSYSIPRNIYRNCSQIHFFTFSKQIMSVQLFQPVNKQPQKLAIFELIGQ